MTTTWHSAKDRAINEQDIGKLIVCKDAFGAVRFGEVLSDKYGICVEQRVPVIGPPIARGAVDTYTLLDKPKDW